MQGSALKILHVIPAVAPIYGGPSKLVLSMCSALNHKGHQSEIVTSSADGHGSLNQPLHRFIDYQGVRCLFFARKLGEGFKYAPGMSAWLHQHVTDYDLVHIHGVFSWSSIAASKACLTRSVPYLVRPLGSLDPWSLKRKSLQKRFLTWLWVERMLQRASRIHYTSAREQREAERGRNIGKGVVLPAAIDIRQLEYEPSPDWFAENFPALSGCQYILFLGRLVPKKKLENLIEAFGRIEVNDGLKLVIAGAGEPEYCEKLRGLARRSAAVQRIIFMNWVEGGAKIALIRNCSLFVLISDNENFGIAVAEAMACGRAVVVNQGVYLCDHILENQSGWVIDKDTELAAVLDSAMQNKAERLRRGARGRGLVKQRFTWDCVVTQLENLYHDCADSK
ncbi:MAG: glycosyltransferase [Arenicellales bacterium]